MAIPFISVLTPAYNAEKYISETIESILNQTYKNFEFIIADDKSTDNTWDIISEYAKKDKRIIPVQNQENLGIAKNRNNLIAKAKGKYIVWQDADDLSYPRRLELQIKYMEKHMDVGICGGSLQFFNDKGDQQLRTYDLSDVELRKAIFKFSPVAQPAAIIRTECFKRLGGYNELLPPAEDIDMSFRIGTLYKFGNIPETVIRYRVHRLSATSKKTKTIIKNTLSVRRTYKSNSAYTFRLSDNFAFAITSIVQYIPYSFVLRIFELLRNINRGFR